MGYSETGWSYMQMITVSSSNLKGVGYEPGDSSLVVHFMNGTLYKYLRVPQATFDALMRAPSKGRFFNDNIKDKFQFVRM
jgi:hypothetical protein